MTRGRALPLVDGESSAASLRKREPWNLGQIVDHPGPRVRFVSVTVEPEVDTPAVLKAYAERFGADLAGWSFLTGSVAEVNDVVRRYGSFAKRVKPGEVDHLFLTSLIDRRGMLRVQYLGYRFDPDEMLRDLRSLLRE